MPKLQKKGTSRLSILDRAGNAYFKRISETLRDDVRAKNTQAAWVKLCMAAVTRDPRGLDPTDKTTNDSMIHFEETTASSKQKKRDKLRPRA